MKQAKRIFGLIIAVAVLTAWSQQQRNDWMLIWTSETGAAWARMRSGLTITRDTSGIWVEMDTSALTNQIVALRTQVMELKSRVEELENNTLPPPPEGANASNAKRLGGSWWTYYRVRPGERASLKSELSALGWRSMGGAGAGGRRMLLNWNAGEHEIPEFADSVAFCLGPGTCGYEPPNLWTVDLGRNEALIVFRHES